MTLASGNRKALGLVLLTGVLAALACWATVLGRSSLSFDDLLGAFRAFDGSREHIVLRDIRVPRVLAGLVVGAALSTAGAIMQAMTGNPLASPDILGINAGAAFAMVISISLFGSGTGQAHVWYAFAGAAVAGTIVYGLGTIGRGASAARLVLAGAITAMFLTAVTTSVLIQDAALLDYVRFWTAGSLLDQKMTTVLVIAPYVLPALVLAMLVRGQVTTLSLGADVSRALGQNLLAWRAIAALIVVVLAGGAVAMAGPIGFVGLIAPHAARMIVGADYRWIMPYSAVLGASLVVLADALGRTLADGMDFPVGVTMALFGAPLFVYLVRRRVGSAS